jgi:hypothetical protein
MAVSAVLALAARTHANSIAFIEPVFLSPSDPSNVTVAALERIAQVMPAVGGTTVHALSMMLWNSSYSPNETVPLPPPDAGVLAYVKGVRAGAPGLHVWAGVSLCPGPEYACMLNYTQSNITGMQLAAAVTAAGLDGAQIYVSPYCNNPDCQRTTGKYAEGIAGILAAFKAAAPSKEIALLANEWDNGEIIVTGGPTAVFSYQTVFYFTSITDCVAQCGHLCGAGENVAYITKANQNFTAIVDYLSAHNVAWLGQLQGASTPESENPSDYWTALAAFAGAR